MLVYVDNAAVAVHPEDRVGAVLHGKPHQLQQLRGAFALGDVDVDPEDVSDVISVLDRSDDVMEVSLLVADGEPDVLLDNLAGKRSPEA